MKNGGGSVLIWGAISWYSAGPVIALNGKITASDYVEDDSSHIQSQKCSVWFEEHEDALHLPWPAQLPYLNISNCCDQF